MLTANHWLACTRPSVASCVLSVVHHRPRLCTCTAGLCAAGSTIGTSDAATSARCGYAHSSQLGQPKNSITKYVLDCLCSACYGTVATLYCHDSAPGDYLSFQLVTTCRSVFVLGLRLSAFWLYMQQYVSAWPANRYVRDTADMCNVV